LIFSEQFTLLSGLETICDRNANSFEFLKLRRDEDANWRDLERPKMNDNWQFFLVSLVLIEKLLRTCDVESIYILIRSKKNEDIHTRVGKIFDDPVSFFFNYRTILMDFWGFLRLLWSNSIFFDGLGLFLVGFWALEDCWVEWGFGIWCLGEWRAGYWLRVLLNEFLTLKLNSRELFTNAILQNHFYY
jgi:hypothetical protein